MGGNRATSNQAHQTMPSQTTLNLSYYALLGLHPSASTGEIRRAYRELSKRYHPDTTQLPTAIATEKFRQLNAAYAILNNPEQRVIYDEQIRYSHISFIQPSVNLRRSDTDVPAKSSSQEYSDRPLSAGEIFALFILILTFIVCLLLAITIGLTRGEISLETLDLIPPNQ